MSGCREEVGAGIRELTDADLDRMGVVGGAEMAVPLIAAIGSALAAIIAAWRKPMHALGARFGRH